MKIAKFILSLAAGVAALAVAQAQVIISYNFGSSGAYTAAASGGTPVNFSISSFSVGNPLGGSVSGNSNPTNTSPSSVGGYTIPAADNGGSAGTQSGNGNFGNAVKTGALDTSTSAYYQFTVTPSAGYAVQLTDFDFGTRSTSTGPVSYTLRSSLDSYSYDITTPGSIGNNSTWSFKDNTFSSVQGALSTAVTFRLYMYGGSGSPGNFTANNRIDDVYITFNTTQVPEPSTYALFAGLSLIGFGVWRRVRR